MTLFNIIILIFGIYLGIGCLLTWLDDRSIRKTIEFLKRDPSNEMMPGSPDFWIRFINSITWPIMVWDFVRAFWIVFKRKNNLN